MQCLTCKTETHNPKFCSLNCAAKYNNTKSPKKIKVVRYCINCKLKLTNRQRKYCSLKCQSTHRIETYILNWQRGIGSGLNTNGCVTPQIKSFLRKKYADRCCLCGWSEINPFTHKVPLVADHLDGNWQNNTELNLQLICPNCDSLQKTYGGANRGYGRKNRK